MRCSIVGCNASRLPRIISQHRLFRNGKYDENWIEAIRSLNGQHVDVLKISNRFSVCDLHFEKCYLRHLGNKYHLTPTAIPTIFPKMLELKKEALESDSERQGSPEFILSDDINNSQQEVSSSGVDVKIEIEDTDSETSLAPDRESTPCRNILDENTPHVRKRRQKFDLDTASPETIKKKCLFYMELHRKKDNILKVIRRKLIRKENKIKWLTARIRELQNAQNTTTSSLD